MATNPYINRVDVVRGNTTDTLINISDTTATAADVAQGMYFYLATGQRVAGVGLIGVDGDELEYGSASNLVGSAIVGTAVAA